MSRTAWISEVVVVGAGIVGASLAFRLAQRGARVTIVDRAGPATGATAASFAYINAAQKRPRDYFDLNLAGMREHPTLRDELGEAPWLIEGGRVQWKTDPEEVTDLAASVAEAHGWGYRAEWLDRPGIAEVEPALRVDAEVERAVLFPDEAAIDAPLLTRTLVELAVRHGAVTHFGAEVIRLDRAGDRVVGVGLAGGERIGANLVVNCAGSDADRIAAFVGRRLPLAPRRGVVVWAAGGTGAVRRVIDGPRLQARPAGRDDGLLMLHLHAAEEAVLLGLAGETAATGEASAPWTETLVARARDAFPSFQDLRPVRWAIGTRPIPADDRTCAGVLRSLPGYAEVVSHSGVTLGPLLGRLIADEVVDGRIDPLLVPFRPERFEAGRAPAAPVAAVDDGIVGAGRQGGA